RIDTAPDGRTGIRFGLSTIKNVGTAAVEGLIEERGKNGPFASLEDFCRRAASKSINRKVVESLVRAGALDCFAEAAGEERVRYRQRLQVGLDLVMSLMQREQKLRDSGQTMMVDMFGDSMPTPLPALELPVVSQVNLHQVLQEEREMLGVY